MSANFTQNSGYGGEQDRPWAFQNLKAGVHNSGWYFVFVSLQENKKVLLNPLKHFNAAEQIWPSLSNPLLPFKINKTKKLLPNLNSSKLPKEINYKKTLC